MPAAEPEPPQDDQATVELSANVPIINFDLDYALVIPFGNVGHINTEEIPVLLPERIAEPPGDAISIRLRTATRGLISGRLFRDQHYVRLPNNMSYQQFYSVTLDSPIQQGDCGAVVVDDSG